MRQYNNFYIRHVIRRTSDFGSLQKLSEIIELPAGSILHMVDNFNQILDVVDDDDDTFSLMPDVTGPLWNLKPIKKHMYNVGGILEGPVSVSTKGVIIRRAAGMAARREFKTKYASVVRFVDIIQELPNVNETQDLISHDLLYGRVRIQGVRATMRMTNVVLANIANAAAMVPDRPHIVAVPITNMVFEKTSFIRSFKKLDRTTIEFPNQPHYLLLLHILNEIHAESPFSIFHQLTDETKANLHFLLYNGDSCICFKLGELKEMAMKRPMLLWDLLNTVNMLAMSNIPQQVQDSMNEGDQTEAVDPTVTTILTEVGTVNSPAFSKPVSEERLKEQNEKNVKTMDEEVVKTVMNNGNLTVAQKERVVKHAHAYKQLKMGDKTLEEIINTPPAQKVEENQLDFLEDDDDIVDKSMLRSRVASFDNDYVEQNLQKDIAEAFLSFQKQGMMLTRLEETHEIDQMNRLTHYTVQYVDADGKQQPPIKITVPIVDENGEMLINGSFKRLKKQRINNPICKISNMRVALNASFKALVERNTTVAHSLFNFVKKLLAKADKDVVQPKLGLYNFNKDIPREDDEINLAVLPYEYTTIGKKMVYITFKEAMMFFRPLERFKKVSPVRQKVIREQEHEYGIFFALDGVYHYFMKVDGTVTGVKKSDPNETTTTTFIDLLEVFLDTTLVPLDEWVELKLMRLKIPVIVPLCYQFGLTTMLKYLKVDYQLYEVGERVKLPVSTIRIRFKDKVLAMPRVPMLNALLFSGLNHFDLKDHLFEEMDEKDAYYDLLQQKGMSIHYMKRIDRFFGGFINAITRDVLFQMGEPTNERDLLIRAASLLTTEDHKPPASESNFRPRSYEIIPATIAKVMDEHFTRYASQPKSAGNKFSMSEYAVYQAIVQSQLMVNVDTINPIRDIKDKSSFTHVGDGGRSQESFVVEDRKYPEDAVGVISEGTTDSGAVAITAIMSADPAIVNTRGMTQPPEHPTAAEILSITGVAMPCLTNDDQLYY